MFLTGHKNKCHLSGHAGSFFLVLFPTINTSRSLSLLQISFSDSICITSSGFPPFFKIWCTQSPAQLLLRNENSRNNLVSQFCHSLHLLQNASYFAQIFFPRNFDVVRVSLFPSLWPRLGSSLSGWSRIYCFCFASPLTFLAPDVSHFRIFDICFPRKIFVSFSAIGIICLTLLFLFLVWISSTLIMTVLSQSFLPPCASPLFYREKFPTASVLTDISLLASRWICSSSLQSFPLVHSILLQVFFGSIMTSSACYLTCWLGLFDQLGPVRTISQCSLWLPPDFSPGLVDTLGVQRLTC